MNKKVIIFSLLLILLCSLVYVFAVEQDSIRTVSVPDNATWVKFSDAGNYSQGFTFTYNVTDDPATLGNYTVKCGLFIGNETSLALLLGNPYNLYDVREDVKHMDTVTLDLNHTLTDLGDNLTDYDALNTTRAYLWSIKCENTTFSPDLPYYATEPLMLLQDEIGPDYVTIINNPFTNSSWTGLNSFTFEIDTIDNWTADYTNPYAVTVAIKNFTTYEAKDSLLASETLLTRRMFDTDYNFSRVNVTWSPADGNYSVYINVSDAAGNTISVSGANNVFVDSAPPASLTYLIPADNNITSNDFVEFNFSFTEQNIANITLDWNGTAYDVETGNCTTTTSETAMNCYYNFSLLEVGDVNRERNKYYSLRVTDNAGNDLQGSNRTITIDFNTIASQTAYNWTVNNGVVTWEVDANTTNPSGCNVNVYNRNNVYSSSIAGSYTDSSANKYEIWNCTGILTSSSLSLDGEFKLETNITDSLGNSALTNWTGIYTQLFTGWNSIAWTSWNTTANPVSEICGQIENCTQVSVYDNVVGSFTTYSTSTPTVNNATDVDPGKAIMVYTSTDSARISENHMLSDSFGSGDSVYNAENFTLYNHTWNHMGLFFDTNISIVYDSNSTVNSTGDYIEQADAKNITYASWLNSSSDKYYTCRRSANLCATTTLTPAQVELWKGYAVIILTDQAGNYTINRSNIYNDGGVQ